MHRRRVRITAHGYRKKFGRLMGNYSGRPFRSYRSNKQFFYLGGHSLSALQLISQIKTKWAVELNLRDMRDAFTLADLATQIIQKESLFSIFQKRKRHYKRCIFPLNRFANNLAVKCFHDAHAKW